MKKFIIGFISIICLSSCNTVKEYAIRIDDDYFTREVKTSIGYNYYTVSVTNVSDDNTYTYKMKIDDKWYIVPKEYAIKYNIGDYIKREDYKKLNN